MLLRALLAVAVLGLLAALPGVLPVAATPESPMVFTPIVTGNVPATIILDVGLVETPDATATLADQQTCDSVVITALFRAEQSAPISNTGYGYAPATATRGTPSFLLTSYNLNGPHNFTVGSLASAPAVPIAGHPLRM